MREIAQMSGCHSNNDLRVHFGFGDATVIDSLVIRWPSGRVDTYTGVAVDNFYVATEAQDIVPVFIANIYAEHSQTDKLYARKDIDSILFTTKFSNIYKHQFTPHLLCAKTDGSQVDSLTLFDDGLHGDSLANDGIYGAYIPPRSSEDYFSLSVSTLDQQLGRYTNVPDLCRFTTIPLLIDSMQYTASSDSVSLVKPYLRNAGTVQTIKNIVVKLTSNDPWIKLVVPDIRSCTNLLPGQIAGVTQPFTVSYNPKTFPGLFNLTFEITSDGQLYWKHSMSLLVTGVEEELGEIVFGSVKIGQFKDTTLTITNSGNGTLKITSIVSTKDYFSVRPTVLTIPPGQSKTDTIRFTADSIGTRNGLILITSNDVTSPHTVTVSGFGIGTPVLSLNKSSITFSSIKIGQWKDTTVTITNTGMDTLKITSIVSTKDYFSVRPTVLTIPPGQSKADTIRFVPDSIGIRSGIILFTSNAISSPDTITVNGNGTTTGIERFGLEIPESYVIFQNYPNPFNPITTIRFGVPIRSYIKLHIYSILGQLVEEIANDEVVAGYYEKLWNAPVASGIYFYRLEAISVDDQSKRFIDVKKLILLK